MPTVVWQAHDHLAAVGALMRGWMLHGDLPPAGNPILLQSDLPPPQYPGYSAHWVNSGTAALALALIVARQARPEVLEPKVILPAYGCPDLVAAAEFAKVLPVLVDIGPDDPGYALASLARALDKDTVAVVAVNFLGIAERLSEIQTILAEHPGTLLIEDNAQWIAAPNHRALTADLVCLSFGRGKPVSLLGGGALFVRSARNLKIPEGVIGATEDAGASFKLKSSAFNLFLNRALYWGINRNPLIGVGQTVFKPLIRITTMDSTRLRYLGANVLHYADAGQNGKSVWDDLQDSTAAAPFTVSAERVGKLLRYPLLCADSRQRTMLMARLSQQGLGASAMYLRVLRQIDGVAGRVRMFESHPGAQRFAERLITLPTHRQVRAQDVTRAKQASRDLRL